MEGSSSPKIHVLAAAARDAQVQFGGHDLLVRRSLEDEWSGAHRQSPRQIFSFENVVMFVNFDKFESFDNLVNFDNLTILTFFTFVNFDNFDKVKLLFFFYRILKTFRTSRILQHF